MTKYVYVMYMLNIIGQCERNTESRKTLKQSNIFLFSFATFPRRKFSKTNIFPDEKFYLSNNFSQRTHP